MTFRQLLNLAAVPVIALVAGCGGGSGSGGTGGGGVNNPTSVTITFKGATPTTVAAKIGAGSFTAQTVNSGVLTLSIPSGTANFAVAFVCPLQTLTLANSQEQQIVQVVLEASTIDGNAFTGGCPGTPSAGQTGSLAVNVDASAIPGASVLTVNAQNGNFVASGIAETPTANFSFKAPSGNDRVEVFAFSQQLQGAGVNINLVAARNLANQTVPGSLNGGNAVVLGPADRTTSEPIAYSGIPSNYSAPTTLVSFNMGGTGGIFATEAATGQYAALPAAAVEAGDFYSFSATAHNSTNPGEAVFVDTTLDSAGPVAIAFPSAWTYAGPAPAALPTFSYNYAGFSGKSGIIYSAILSWSPAGLQQNLYEVSATANYQNGATTLAVPDLSGLAGFLQSPASGTSLFWGAFVEQNSWPAFQPMPTGGTSTVVTNSGTFTVP